MTVTGGQQYTGNVVWTPGGNFVAGTAYTAKVTLNAATGWTFDGIGAGNSAFTYSGAVSVTNQAGTGAIIEVTINFPAFVAVVKDRNLTDKISVPVADEEPKDFFTSTQYNGSIDWEIPSGGNYDGHFVERMAYTAKVRLSATTGLTFDGIEADAFIHDNAQSVTNQAGTGSEIVVTINFPATDAGETVITGLDLTDRVPRPVAGELPTMLFREGDQYIGTVTWTTGGNPHSGNFVAGKVYTATVALRRMSSKLTFGGIGAGATAFTHRGAVSVTNTAGSEAQIEVTIVFPPIAVEPVDLTNYIPKPVAGERATLDFSEGNNELGRVGWRVTGSGEQHGLFFRAKTSYTATVTLYATNKWTGIEAGNSVFSHNDAVSAVTNTAGTEYLIVITIVFPPTE
jgi:hypothetical protein